MISFFKLKFSARLVDVPLFASHHAMKKMEKMNERNKNKEVDNYTRLAENL